MNSYDVILRSGNQVKELTIRAGNGDAARAAALEKAAELNKQTGTFWNVARVDPA